MSDTHSKIIAAAAKTELTSLGFRRKGQSRLWLADRGSWLNVVEFTPSRWSKSVSLMNAAHWLWVDAGFMSFNEAVSSNCYAEFETEDQFRSAAGEIAKTARANALAMDERFSSFDMIADFVIERARSSPERMGPSWWGYEAGIASGLIGSFEEAGTFLHGVTDNRVTGRAAPLLPLIADPEGFRGKVNDVVAQERTRLKLKALARPAF
ncbi:hypothetical protein [Sphingomonas xinjiangensis]|uniref:DUF4304 domain-containing protein n=1 Tax=Sphingomonas xinjiangensis TaxID=643568 RepID=A0A840YSY0_9SPHN|nr:hypothetical protein [Sphingomonas xinjiangensis]MBB5712806.1 hypothetical protein [Sphingomonas xinjiangensis]